MKFCPTCKSKFPTDINYCPNDATKLLNDPEAGPSHSLIGMILDNRYRVISKLGEGGMGAVYAAEHVLLKKGVAIKVLRYDLARKDDVVRRFQNEAIAASRIGHENIIEVTDFGKTPDGSVYFVMEQLNGVSLANIIQRSGSLPQKRAIPILLQITKALSVAHSQGIIHRDLKPENIVLIDKTDRKDFVKILDFGISKMLDTSDRAEKLTAMGMIVGTPEYMSPEQAAGMPVDKRTDIYSLGVIMYEMLTGRLPFLADNAIRILMMHQTENPISPRKINPEIHPSFEQTILKCMEKKAENRFQEMSEITEVLLKILSSSTRLSEPRKTIAFNPQAISNTAQQSQEIPTGQSAVLEPNPVRATIQYNSGITQVSPIPTSADETTSQKEIVADSLSSQTSLDNSLSQISSQVSSDNVISEPTSNIQLVEKSQDIESIEPKVITDRDSFISKVDAPSIKDEEDVRPIKGEKAKWRFVVGIVGLLVIVIGITLFVMSGKGVRWGATTPQQNLDLPPVPAVNTEVPKVDPEQVKKDEILETTITDKEESKIVRGERSARVSTNVESALLEISSIPENVEIYRGNSLIGVTPYRLKGRLNSSAEYIFKKTGYEPLKKRFVFDTSKKIQINLKKIESERKPASHKEKDPFEKIDDLKDLKF